MSAKKPNLDPRARRHRRVRKKVSGTAERPRLAVFRSNKHIYAQVIDDVAGRTLAAASTEDSSLKGGTGGNVEAATKVGASSPSAPRPPASTRSCSTGAGSATTAASRPSPTPPAPVDWSSDE